MKVVYCNWKSSEYELGKGEIEKVHKEMFFVEDELPLELICKIANIKDVSIDEIVGFDRLNKISCKLYRKDFMVKKYLITIT